MQLRAPALLRRTFVLGLLVAPWIALAGEPRPERITTTGWFSDMDCATSRVAAGRVGPTGRACAQKCLAKGVKLAFIDETAKAVFEVDNPKTGKAILGDHVELVGTRSGRVLHVESVKVLEKYIAKCDVK